jgi:hypothetical protein
MNFISRLFGSRALPGTAKENDGFLDIDVPIATNQVDGAVARIACRGSINGEVIGFGIELRPEWELQTLEGSNAEVFGEQQLDCANGCSVWIGELLREAHASGNRFPSCLLRGRPEAASHTSVAHQVVLFSGRGQALCGGLP